MFSLLLHQKGCTMPINSLLRALVLGATVCVFAGCSSAGTLTPGGRQASNAAGSASVPGFMASEVSSGQDHLVRPALGARCKAFAPIFAEAAACQRANGTLESFKVGRSLGAYDTSFDTGKCRAMRIQPKRKATSFTW